MTRKFLLAALVILLAALCTVHLTTERTPPENVVSPAVHLGMVVPREALEKLKAAETAALAAPQTAEPTADVTAEPAEEESLPATDTSVLAPPMELVAKPTGIRENSTSGGASSARPMATAMPGPTMAEHRLPMV